MLLTGGAGASPACRDTEQQRQRQREPDERDKRDSVIVADVACIPVAVANGLNADRNIGVAGCEL